MTTFMMGNESGMVIGQATRLMFWTDDILICHQHSRGMFLQPFLAADKQAGFGKRGCPFCEGGELAGTFHQYRSKRKLEKALNKLEATP